ncbi:hypothetical protein P9139_18160 [Curtobacterium flaccumfaciens]|nr:hypothetical protein P9139_18160 [Curtobacterium flaccumfaciens]
MAADEDLGRLVAELQQKVEILERATQMQHSTVQTGSGTVGVGDAVATTVETAAALPVVADQAVTAQDTADSVAVLADDWDADLDDRLDAAAADLDDARADLEESQSDIEDAFGQTVDGLSEDVETAITAAGSAKTEAEAASDAALAAANLAGTKGKTIVQVSARRVRTPIRRTCGSTSAPTAMGCRRTSRTGTTRTR